MAAIGGLGCRILLYLYVTGMMATAGSPRSCAWLNCKLVAVLGAGVRYQNEAYPSCFSGYRHHIIRIFLN